MPTRYQPSKSQPTCRPKGSALRPSSSTCWTSARSEAIQQVIGSRDRLDVLANNAGINRRGGLLSLMENDWDLSFAVNVDSLFHLCRAVLPHMVESGGGAIVNTASQWGLHPAPGHIAYNVSKAAVVAFTQNLARD